jgi:hypothetical protein
MLAIDHPKDPVGLSETIDRERYDRLVVDLSTRLRRACAHMPDAEYGALVDRIAQVTARFWAIEANPAFWRSLDSKSLPLAPLPDQSDEATILERVSASIDTT